MTYASGKESTSAVLIQLGFERPTGDDPTLHRRLVDEQRREDEVLATVAATVVDDRASQPDRAMRIEVRDLSSPLPRIWLFGHR